MRAFLATSMATGLLLASSWAATPGSSPAPGPSSRPASSKPASQPAGGLIKAQCPGDAPWQINAKRANSQKAILKLVAAAKKYQADKGQAPVSADELVKAGMIAADALVSPGDARFTFVFIPGNLGKARRAVVAYDPVSYSGQVVAGWSDSVADLLDSEAKLQEALQGSAK